MPTSLMSMTKAGVGSKRFPSSITWIDQRSPPAACEALIVPVRSMNLRPEGP
ncbi:MAG TPA: hypothetical protein PLH94_04605 [Fimbriimonadaceae bacterium]|nr:hypothetical protein [Fimbriimonadaceae bacterium]